MSFSGRVTMGVLWIVCSVPGWANTVIWTEGNGRDAGSLPASAQAVWGQNEPLDAIFGSLDNPNDADMFQILITDPINFSATVSPNPFDPDTQIIPQIFLFDLRGFPVSGGFAAFLGDASLPFGPDAAGYYFLMVNSVGSDPIFTTTDPATGNPVQTPLFSQDFSFNAPAWVPVPGAAPVDGYQGQGIFPGSYLVSLTGTTAPNPEPGSVVLLLSGLAFVLTRARKKRLAIAGLRASSHKPS